MLECRIFDSAHRASCRRKVVEGGGHVDKLMDWYHTADTIQTPPFTMRTISFLARAVADVAFYWWILPCMDRRRIPALSKFSSPPIISWIGMLPLTNFKFLLMIGFSK